ncbi:hypothetical protein [Pontibacter flavimaris]|uniref:Recombination associated protein RdgC n=1 Tax=Pontibacter flavimaris TaxID=1797110 RepID=A0A1Q5PE48_9BACT|nr:hypothetical protein [Pontibacter flavimaris]OKL40487.1 hypothetical protein A3841_19510 [Pontibacter flavimaris]
MENNTSQNQNNNKNSNSNNSGGSQQKGGQKKEGSVMQLLQPHDMSKTVESALHVFQGRHEKLPDLMQDLGHIIVKTARRLTTTQLILATGALTIGAILVARYSSEDDAYAYEED